MTLATPVAGVKLLILLGDGGSPETFSAPCGIVSKTMELALASTKVTVPDCGDPEAIAWAMSFAKELSSKVTGAGILAEESFNAWNTAMLVGAAVNFRIKLDGAALNGYWAGSYIITSLKFTGNLGDAIKIDVALDNAGVVAWVAT